MGIFQGALALIDLSKRIARYKMQETSGTTLDDSIGSNDFTISGSTVNQGSIIPTEPSSKSIAHDGVDDREQRTLPAAFKIANIGFICCIRTPASGPSQWGIFHLAPRGSHTSTARGCSLILGGGASRIMVVRKGNGSAGNIEGQGTTNRIGFSENVILMGVIGSTGMRVYVGQASGLALDINHTNTDAISWVDMASGNYPDPATGYFGAYKVNNNSPDATTPANFLTALRHCEFHFLNAELSADEYEIVYQAWKAQTFTTPSVEATIEQGILSLAWDAISGATGYDVGIADVTDEDTTTIVPTQISTNQAGLTLDVDTTTLPVGVPHRFYVKKNGTNVWRVSEKTTFKPAKPGVFTNPANGSTHLLGVSISVDCGDSISNPDSYEFSYSDGMGGAKTVFDPTAATSDSVFDPLAIGTYQLHCRAELDGVFSDYRDGPTIDIEQIEAPTWIHPTSGLQFVDEFVGQWDHDDPTNYEYEVEQKSSSGASYVPVADNIVDLFTTITRPVVLVSVTAKVRVRAKSLFFPTAEPSDWVESDPFTWLPETPFTPLEQLLFDKGFIWYYPRMDSDVIDDLITKDYSGHDNDGEVIGSVALEDELLPNSGASLDCTAGAHIRVPPINLVNISYTFIMILKIPAAQWSGQRNLFAVTGDIDSGANGKNVKAQVDLSGANDGKIGAIITRNNVGVAGPDKWYLSPDSFNKDVSIFIVDRYDHVTGLHSSWVNGVKVDEEDIDNLTEVPVKAAIGAYLNEDGTLNGNRLDSIIAHPGLALRAFTDNEIEEISTLTQHPAPIILNPDNGDILVGASLTHQWIAPDGETEGDISFDGGLNFVELFPRQAVGIDEFVHDISAIPNSLGIITRYRTWRDAGSIVSTADYSTYVYREWNVWRTQLPLPHGNRIIGISAVTDNLVRVDETDTGQDHVRVELDTYPSGNFSSPLVSKVGNTPIRTIVYGLPNNTKFRIRRRKEDISNNPLEDWKYDRIWTKRIKHFIDSGDPDTHVYEHYTEVTGNMANFSVPGRYVTHSGDTSFIPLDPENVPQFGVGMQEWSADEDPKSRGVLFGLRTDEAFAQDWGIGTWSTELLAVGDASLNPRTVSGLNSRKPFAFLIVFVPWSEFVGEVYEIGGGDGWWMVKKPDDKLYARFNMSAYGISGNNNFQEANPPQILLGDVVFDVPNIALIGCKSPHYSLDIRVEDGCTVSDPEPGSIITTDIIGVLNKKLTTLILPPSYLQITQSGGVGCNPYVAGYLEPDLGDAIYIGKGTSWGAKNVNNVNGRVADCGRMAVLETAYWNNKVPTASEINAIFNAFGSSNWVNVVMDSSPHFFCRHAMFPGPRPMAFSVI